MMDIPAVNVPFTVVSLFNITSFALITSKVLSEEDEARRRLEPSHTLAYDYIETKYNNIILLVKHEGPVLML